MFSKVLYEAAKETLVEYLNKTSLNGCYLLYCIRKSKYQRLVWSVFIVMTVAFASYICSTTLTSFLRDPIVTTIDPHVYTIYEAPFPSVAVCSHNKFSRKALLNYALNISLHSETNQTLTYWMKHLEMLSALYKYDSVDFEAAEELHKELENILGEKFVTSKILQMLAPLCEDVLVKCFWAGEAINCKQEFELKMFLDGPCCVFNYQYKKDLASVYYPEDTGALKGLAFLVNASTSDYFYAENSAIGFHVKLFSTQFVPDIKLGDVDEFYVGVAEDVNVHLRLKSQVTSEHTRLYSVHKRRCYFLYEQAKFGSSECILKCIANIIGSGCECKFFYAVNSDIEYMSDAETVIDECSLLHLGCLKFYEYELLDSSQCVDCYPMCSYNDYWHRKNVNPLNTTLWSYTNRKYLNHTMEITPDVSLVKIFYLNGIATKYKKTALYKWHHILSNIGGVIGICMGCSIINGIEMLYFGCYRLMEKFLKLRRAQQTNTHESITN